MISTVAIPYENTSRIVWFSYLRVFLLKFAKLDDWFFIVLERTQFDDSIRVPSEDSEQYGAKLWRLQTYFLFYIDLCDQDCSHALHVSFFLKENMILLMYWDELSRSSCFAHASVKQSWSCDLFLEICLHDVIRMVQPREKGCQRLHTSFSVLLMWQRDGRSWDKIIKRKTNWEFMDCSAC